MFSTATWATSHCKENIYFLVLDLSHLLDNLYFVDYAGNKIGFNFNGTNLFVCHLCEVSVKKGNCYVLETTIMNTTSRLPSMD